MKTPPGPFTPPPGASYDQWSAAALAESEALVAAARKTAPPVECREFTLVPLRHPAGRVKMQLAPKADAGDIFKDRAGWLLDALGARYTHRTGSHLSPARAEAFNLLYRAGFHGMRRLTASDKRTPTYSPPMVPNCH